MSNKLYEFEVEKLIADDLSDNNGEKLVDRGFSLHKDIYTHEKINYVFRQFDLGGYGIPDIIALGKFQFGNISANIAHIMELKAVPLQIEHLSQILRYRRGIDTILSKAERDQTFGFHTKYYLIGRGLSDSFTDFYCIDVLKNSGISLITYDFCIEKGIVFKDHTYSIFYLKEPKYEKAVNTFKSYYGVIDDE